MTRKSGRWPNFNSFEIDQRVNGNCCCFIICFVCFASESRPKTKIDVGVRTEKSRQVLGHKPPRSCPHREPCVGDHRYRSNSGKVPPEFICLISNKWSKLLIKTYKRPTRIPQTIVISNAVGAILKMIACSRNVMPLVPLSIALVSPPVCRLKWNLRSRLSRCSNVSRATFRMARCPIFANTALRSSPERVAPILAAPSVLGWCADIDK